MESVLDYAETQLTQTAAGTPAGDLLRRYWQPVAVQIDLTEETPIRAVRVLSEGLVLFRDRSGAVGLIQERCPHNGYPLLEGHVDDNSIACYRHGWHFDGEGACWVDGYQGKAYPIQWANARTYPVQVYAGLYWAYLGRDSSPAPLRLDALERADGLRRLTVQPVVECSWTDLAIEGLSGGNSLLFPTHTNGNSVCLHMPVDDRHTWQIIVEFVPGEVAEAETSNGRTEIVVSYRPVEPPPIAHQRPGADVLWERWRGELERFAGVAEPTVA